MVHETEEGSNSYMERPRQSIFAEIQIYVGDNPGSIDPPSMRKGPNKDYREYAIRWKNVASMVRLPLTNREENFMFVDILFSPYYDMLVVNAFVEFGDLMYFVGRIKDGIRKGKIADTGCKTLVFVKSYMASKMEV